MCARSKRVTGGGLCVYVCVCVQRHRGPKGEVKKKGGGAVRGQSRASVYGGTSAAKPGVTHQHTRVPMNKIDNSTTDTARNTFTHNKYLS